MKIILLLAGNLFACSLFSQTGVAKIASQPNIGVETLGNSAAPGESSFIKCSFSCTVVQPKIFITDVTVQETVGNALVTVSLSSSSSEIVKVKYKTVNGTAKHPKDYDKAMGEIVFNPNETFKQVAVAIESDDKSEPSENFFIELTHPVNATIADNTGEVTILDVPALITRNNIAEENGLPFLVNVSPNPSQSDFLLTIINGNEAFTEIIVYDAVGRLIKTFTMKQANATRLGKELKTGVYTLVVKQGDKKQIVRVVKL